MKDLNAKLSRLKTPTEEDFDLMFELAHVSRQKLEDALRKMGKKHVRSGLKHHWSPENPTRMYCYVVAEFVYNWLAPAGSTSYKLVPRGEETNHRFVRWPMGEIVDLSGIQFRDDYSVLDYTQAKKCGFMHPSPSKRARILAELLGYPPLGQFQVRLPTYSRNFQTY